MRQELETKFTDLELQVLTIIQFDFDYGFGTPFAFYSMFHETHHSYLKTMILAEKLEDFNKNFYSEFVS